ncbi:MAG TPA: hypothetical protein VD913_04605, partial [bacterium]|nr:hypothetical protein [bacterium]
MTFVVKTRGASSVWMELKNAKDQPLIGQPRFGIPKFQVRFPNTGGKFQSVVFDLSKELRNVPDTTAVIIAFSDPGDVEIQAISFSQAKPRSEVRATVVPEIYQDMKPFDFLVTQLQFEKMEAPQEKKRRPIINAFDSVHMNEFPDLFTRLWKNWPDGDLAKPLAVILERYIGIGGYEFLKKDLNPDFLRILDRYGITIQTLMRGRHQNTPVLLPGPFVDPQTLDIAQQLREKSRSKNLRSMGNTIAQYLPEGRRKSFNERYRRILALSERDGPSSVVWFYTSDYGRVEVLESLLQSMERALRRRPDLYKERNLVLFTHLTRGRKYTQFNPATQRKEEFYYHDQLLNYIHSQYQNERVLFYDFQDVTAPFFPFDSGKSKIYVINLPAGLSAFDSMQNLSDLAVIAGDMGVRQMFTLPGLDVGPVFMPYPHPHGQADMRNQYLDLLEQNALKRFNGVPKSVKDLMKLLEYFLTIQDPNFTPDRRFSEELIRQISGILINKEEAKRYRDAEALLLEGERNAFNFLLNLLGEIDRGRTAADIKADLATVPFETGFEISRKRSLFKKSFLVLTVLNFTVGFGDAAFVRQLLQAVTVAGGRTYNDVAILLLDDNLESLMAGLLKMEKIYRGSPIDLNRLRFIVPHEGEDGKLRLHFLRRRPDAESINGLLKKITPDSRSELRSRH